MSVMLTVLAMATFQVGTAPSSEAKICRRVEALTGSRLSRKTICATAAEWDQYQRWLRKQERDNHFPISGR